MGTAGYLRTEFVTRVSLDGKRLWLFPLTTLKFMKPDPVVSCSEENLKRGKLLFWLTSHLGHCFSTGWPGICGLERIPWSRWLLIAHSSICRLSVRFVQGKELLKYYFLENGKFSAVLVVLCTGLLPSFHSLSVNNVFKLQGWKAMFVDSLLVLMSVQGTVSLCHFADLVIANAWELVLCNKAWLKIIAV